MTLTPLTDAMRRQWADACNHEAALMEAMNSHSSLEHALAAAQAELAARSSITQALSEGRITLVTIDRTPPSTSLGKVRIVVELDVI